MQQETSFLVHLLARFRAQNGAGVAKISWNNEVRQFGLTKGVDCSWGQPPHLMDIS